MVKRIIIGTNGLDVGMWVSKPTKAADSTVYDDLLIDTTRINTQPILKGLLVNPTLNYNTTLSQAITTNVSLAYDPLYNTYYNVAFAQPGWATWDYIINHNIGYIPLCHISISSANAGEAYPQVYLTTTQLILRYTEYKDAETAWNGAYYQTLTEDGRPATYTFNCNIGYTLFRQQAV